MATSTTRRRQTGRIILLGLLLAITGFLFYRYLSTQPGGVLGPPAEYSLKYRPAELQLNIDPEEALAIINNPRRYKREFDRLVYDINSSILDHVSNRMGLSDSLRAAVQVEYERQHPYLRELYYNDFINLKDTSGTLYETWYDNNSANSTEIFHEVASKYTCFLVNQVLATVIQTDKGRIYAKGTDLETPCGIAMGEALTPLINRMEERAAIEDFSRSRGLLQEKVENVIAELAVLEVRDKKGINKQMQTKIWGFNVSRSDVEITAISILKVGFRINDYFDVELDSRNSIVTVTLPEPTILSHEVYPKIERLDIGWLREVENVSINEGINSLRGEFRREAYESNMLERSKEQAVDLMNTMFAPLIQSFNSRYTLKVQFYGGSDPQPFPSDPVSSVDRYN